MIDPERTRKLLDELMPCPPAPGDFAQRVLQARAARPRARRWPYVAAGALAVAATVVILVGRRDTGAGASTRSADRQTVHIGSRAVAVLEPGGELTWSGRWSGLRVEQAKG